MKTQSFFTLEFALILISMLILYNGSTFAQTETKIELGTSPLDGFGLVVDLDNTTFAVRAGKIVNLYDRTPAGGVGVGVDPLRRTILN